LSVVFTRCYILMVLFLLSAAGAQAQSKEHILKGIVKIKDGETCKYVIGFTLSGNSLTGYSNTTNPEGIELKASIKGSINRKKHTLSFMEFNTVVDSPNEACLFDARLSYQTVNGQMLVGGAFTGRDAQNKYCGEGTIVFAATAKPDYLFEKEKPKPAPVEIPQADTVAKITASAFTKVKSGEQQQLACKADTCTLEIWDGEVVDGDIVTIMVDKQIVLQHYTLTANKRQLKIPLREKTTTLTILAENEGKAPPNTSMVLLTSGKTQTGFLVCLETGKTADILLKKK